MQRQEAKNRYRFGETPEEALSCYSDQGIYSSIRYGSPRVSKGLRFAESICQRVDFYGKTRKLLCLGSGNAYEAVLFLMKGHDCYVAELYHPRLEILSGRQIKTFGQALPFRHDEFDLLFCCETMEHIPEELTDQVLSECKRVSREVFFTVATRDDPPFNTHICIHNAQWWMDKFEELGFEIINAQKNPVLIVSFERTYNQAVIMSSPSADGVLINAGC